mmetsp:Transcript_93119/g.289805  ORF Transcript_93119/g.289805 Transcript_93119/m.289805 type:complete len:109 (-) Transcript_93119:21-347(-)
MKQLRKQFDDLVLLLFPCGQFGDQELKTAGEIKEFVRTKGLTAPGLHIMPRGDVTGPNGHPVWKFMKDECRAADPQWNFTCKFLVSPQGDVSQPGKDAKADVGRLLGQ